MDDTVSSLALKDARAGMRMIVHPSFETADAARLYGAETRPQEDQAFADTFMPDEVTRDYAQRMHYAAYRVRQADRPAEAARWQQRYYHLRDQIVIGNRKLMYRAVRQRMYLAPWMDDMIGECSLVLIRAVAAYNPWRGIRFSTYAFTCLMRALSRLGQRMTSDRLVRALSLETVADQDLGHRRGEEPESAPAQQLDEYLQEGHPLLSAREKMVLSRRYGLADNGDKPTLEAVGRELGISKERVRQVQASALSKLRQQLGTGREAADQAAGGARDLASTPVPPGAGIGQLQPDQV